MRKQRMFLHETFQHGTPGGSSEASPLKKLQISVTGLGNLWKSDVFFWLGTCCEHLEIVGMFPLYF